MAEAFTAGGLSAYIGSVEPDPQATSMALFMVHLFHNLLCRGQSVREAWERAASYGEDSRLVVLHDGGGRHRAGTAGVRSQKSGGRLDGTSVRQADP